MTKLPSLLSIALICFALSHAAAQNALDQYEQGARDLVHRMTLDEKISQLHGIGDDRKGIYRSVRPVTRPGIRALRITNGPAAVGSSSQSLPQHVQLEVK